MNRQYKENGYFVLRGFFTDSELSEITKVVLGFHESWKQKNSQFYYEKAVNSAYLTGTEHLDELDRSSLFRFIGASKLMKVVSEVLPERPVFLNTQLFFNPMNASQRNYWHRDPQYHLSLHEQKEALAGPEVVHFRIPLADEPGIELVPGTHKRWDTGEELDIRLENKEHRNYDDISTGRCISLERGDLLVFSANMIHRGIYGLQRLSLDIMYGDAVSGMMAFVRSDCLPDQAILNSIEDPTAFLNTIDLNNKYKKTNAEQRKP